MQVNILNIFDFGFVGYRKYILVVSVGAALAVASPVALGQSATPGFFHRMFGASQPAGGRKVAAYESRLAQSNGPMDQSAPAPASQPTQSAPQPPADSPAANTPDVSAPTLRVQSNEVDLVFTVTDKNGKFVTGLNQSSFGLLDDGRPPESVLHFYAQKDLPLRVGIMLDTSSSIRQRFKFEQDAAIAFLLQVLHRNDRAFVEGFDVQTDVEQGFTNNIDLLNQGIRRLRPGGGTALFDALYTACKDQMLTLRETGAVRKAIVLVTDGDDDYSHAFETDAIKECQRADTIVYTISTDISPTRDKGGEVLRRISETTGGQPFYPKRIEDVALGFNSIEEELRSQYLLEYRPANFKQDGSFRTIYLHANDSRYHVRAHTGYFAPKAAE